MSLNPFLPAARRGRRPELQPTLVITGITSLRKLQVKGACAFFTRTVERRRAALGRRRDDGLAIRHRPHHPGLIDRALLRIGRRPLRRAGPVFLVAYPAWLPPGVAGRLPARRDPQTAGSMVRSRGERAQRLAVQEQVIEALPRRPITNSSLIGSMPRSTSGIGRPCAPGSSSSSEIPRPS